LLPCGIARQKHIAKFCCILYNNSIPYIIQQQESTHDDKTELIAAMAEISSLSKKDCEAALTAFVAATENALKAGDKVQLVGFGTFEAKVRAAHIGRNPATGAEIKIPASKAPAFKAGKTFKDSVQ